MPAVTDTAQTTSEPSSRFDLMAELNQLRQLDAAQIHTAITEYVLPALAALAVILVGYFVAKLAARVISTPVIRRVDETLGRFVGKFVFYGVLAGITLATLSKIGAPVGGLAALVAAAGFAIGLAFQGTLSNFASGVLLLVFRPFKVGDFVNAGGVMGKVNEIDLFTVTLDTPDNRRIIVPNSSISGGTIENISFHRHRRVEVLVGVEYDACIDRTRQVLTAAAEAMRPSLVEGPGRDYQVILDGLGASSVDWKVRFWTHNADFFAVKEQLTEHVKKGLDQAGIGIPFPQMDVHVSGWRESAPAAPATTRMRPRPARQSA
ncbi:mechanosensitive ion channel family protein [Roseimaritima sediminicola]|uniref:mechanosensitive ion channel family protein n=1 Tax=Roseimaritima sediminicola TaxID=2662066 RepID=UPI0012982891|nr:mechanosensitive ion channel domain-containing protein [Roseimaritima sediminicola]